MRNCILVDPNVEPSAAQFIPDPAVSKTVGCSRKPQEYVNGFDVIIALQRWQLERGSFLHQLDGNNCGPIRHEIESGVEVDDLDSIVCEVKDHTSKSRLYGATWSTQCST
jgi:hypothetical protein